MLFRSRWFLSRLEPLRAPDGTLLYWIGINLDIEELKCAEEKIREQETELRQVLDFAPQLIAVFGPRREPLFTNRTALDYFGLSLDEWRDKGACCAVGHPDDSERLQAQWDRAVSSGAAFEIEARLRKGDGSYRWYLSRYNTVRDHEGQVLRWYVACTDIEDRKLRRSREVTQDRKSVV